MNNKKIGILFFAFGIILIIGAIMGYAKAHSVISLVAGGSFGIGIVIGSLLIAKKNILGFYIAFTLSFLVGFVFLLRFIKTGATFPGVMAMLSALVILSGFLLTKKR